MSQKIKKNIENEYSSQLRKLECVHVMACGNRKDLSSVAHALYDCLRLFDALAVDVILAETFDDRAEQGIGHAIMNRLQKAATHVLQQ